ncbi:uncharacterized protein [Primulina eburnea]|uniref:uncharacterized protein n=1 Tax=Primulina eburnea TaxID=1245227 RepID=UPI003C6C0781
MCPVTENQEENSVNRQENNQGNGPSPPPPDVATRALEGMARLFEQQLQQQQLQQQQLQLQLQQQQQTQQAPRPPQDIYDQFRRLGPKEFSGTTDPFAAESWIRSLEVHIRYLNMGDADRVRCTTYMLRDDASLWWEGVEHGVNLATITWPQFKEIFYEKGCHFVPLIARDPAEKLRHFMDGLRPSLRNNVMMMHPLDYATATTCAFKSEQALRDIDFEIQRKRQQHHNNSQPSKKQNTGPPRPQGPQKPQGQIKKQGQQRPQNQGAPPPTERQPCKECNRPNLGKCEWETYKCFYCKENGHKAVDCPKRKAPTVGRAYVMNAEEAEEEADTTLITGRIIILGIATYALLDSRATHSFISETFIKRLKITPQDMGLGFKVSIPSGDQMLTSKIVKDLELRLFKNVVQADLIVLPMPEFDIILEMDWLSVNGASIDFSQRSVSIRPPDGKPFVF